MSCEILCNEDGLLQSHGFFKAVMIELSPMACIEVSSHGAAVSDGQF